MRVDKFGHILALLAVIVFALFACGAVAPSPLRVESSGRTFERVVHADARFNDRSRAAIDSAAGAWAEASRGRASIQPVYDLDEESLPGLLASHASILTIVPDASPLAEQVDGHLMRGNRMPLAATMVASDGTTMLVFMGDRFTPDRFRVLAMHEFGHLIGLPDLPARGAVMSGIDDGDVSEFTPADVALCRSAGLCP